MPNSAHLRVYGPLPLPGAPLELRLTLLLITVARPNTLTVEHRVNSMDVAAFLCSCVSAVSVHTVYSNSPLISCVMEKSPSGVFRLLGKTQEYDACWRQTCHA